jgi:exodeoxyribonuclease VII small subunit
MAKDTVDYASMNAELEEIIAQLQQDSLDIDAAIKAYERGLKLVTQLETYLQAAENKVSKLNPARGANAATE